jgi:murein DD-endopeptidase MepM/ murein hydrolase activator NlpD
MRRTGALLCLAFLLVALQLAGQQSYVLRRGDTLYRVSRRFDVPVTVLQAYNGIKNPSQLREGGTVVIPESYTVRKGDTLYGIARERGVVLGELAKLNGIGSLETLVVGRKLYLPAAAGYQASPQVVQTPPPADTLFWPHPGRREALTGRITGALIHGNAGDRVLSVSPGRVVWVGPYRGFSRVVLIESENGYTYVYAGNEETLVTVGDRVKQGTEIGLLGKNAHQGTPQLYFLVYRDGLPVDPSQAPRS